MKAIITVINDDGNIISKNIVLRPKSVEISPATNIKVSYFDFCIAEALESIGLKDIGWGVKK